MALYDNKYWLLSHIRNSFISTDDTGMSNSVMVAESKLIKEQFFDKEPFPNPDHQSDEDDDDDVGSYDIQFESEFGIRERSMTAAELERLEFSSKKEAGIQHIRWESKSKHPEPTDLFIINNKQKEVPKISALSIIIEKTMNVPINPYTEFARHDGSAQVNIPTKIYRIFLTMLPEEERNYPLVVCCVATARIYDLIGLILFKFSTKYRGDYKFKGAAYYGLYITEEDGEVDRDFPHLDPRECVAKFGFTCLGLVEHNDPYEVTLTDQHYETSSLSVPIQEKTRTISSSKAEEQIQNDLSMMEDHNKAMEAPMYKTYTVLIVNKLRLWKVDVYLGVSGEKIEIDPIQQKNSKLQLVKQASVSHPIDSIAWCEETDTRGAKGGFKIVYSNGFGSTHYTNSFSLASSLQSSPSFKHYDFEADKAVAEEVVQKINLILNLRSSQSRREYLAAKEKKQLSKKKSFKYLRS